MGNRGKGVSGLVFEEGEELEAIGYVIWVLDLAWLVIGDIFRQVLSSLWACFAPL